MTPLCIRPVGTQTVTITQGFTFSCLSSSDLTSPVSLCAEKSTHSMRLPPSRFTVGMLLDWWWAVCFLQTPLDYSCRVTFFILSEKCFALRVMLFFQAVTSLSTLTHRPASAALTVVIQNVLSQQTLYFCQKSLDSLSPLWLRPSLVSCWNSLFFLKSQHELFFFLSYPRSMWCLYFFQSLYMYICNIIIIARSLV